MKKTLTRANGKKKPQGKSVKRAKKSAKKNETRVIKLAVKKNGKLETKEEREKRLARLEALTIRAFQMAYDNYHRQ